MNENVYLPLDIRAIWEEYGRENMILFLRYGLKIFVKYMEALPELLIFLEDKPKLMKFLLEKL